VSPEPKRRSRAAARKSSSEAGQARVKRELLAETNGPHTTSELLIFSPRQLLRSHSDCHAERSSEESKAILTAKSKHPLSHHGVTRGTQLPRTRICENPREPVARSSGLPNAQRPTPNTSLFTSPHSPAHPQHKSAESSAPAEAAPETPHAARSDTSTPPRTNCPTADSHARAQSSPAKIS
jgi:hypothetical protein